MDQAGQRYSRKRELHHTSTQWISFIAAAISVCAVYADEPAPVYLSDVPGSIVLSTQDWGELGIDTCAHQPGQAGVPLRIGEQEYKKGLGSHANGAIVIDLGGAYRLFEAEVGLQWQNGGPGHASFQVIVDEKKVFDSGRMMETSPAAAVRVPLEGAQELVLMARTEGGITNCAANWAQARLIRSEQVSVSKSSVETVDIAPFGRILTWDPTRLDGCRNNRFQDFTVEDLYPETDVVPDGDRMYMVPVSKDAGCIGLQWLEQRHLRSIGIQFASEESMPSSEGVQVQYWVMTRQGGSPGGSVWQGRWETLNGTIQKQGAQWTYLIDWKDSLTRQRGTLKVRWIFPATDRPIRIRRMTAFTDSKWKTTELVLQTGKGKAGKSGIIEMYNGEIIGKKGQPSLATKWNTRKPLRLKVRYCTTTHWMTDRTVLRFKLDDHAFGVAVDDILQNGCVYVEGADLLAASSQAALNLDDYKASIAGKQTLLDRVDALPDQTFSQAQEHVHRAAADLGPTLLSLAADNCKFLVQRDGSVEFNKDPSIYNAAANAHSLQKYVCRMTPVFGAVDGGAVSRELQNGWIPIVVTEFRKEQVIYRQRTFVAPYGQDSIAASAHLFANRKPLCTTQFTIENPQDQPAAVSLAIKLLLNAETNETPDLQPAAAGTLATHSGKVFASVQISEAAGLQQEIKDGVWMLTGRLAAGTKAHVTAYLPGWDCGAEGIAAIGDPEILAAATETYWRRVMQPAMQIEIPDPMLQNLFTASQVHCMLAARNEDYMNVAAWIASSDYGALESEAQSVIRGMQFTGNHEFALKAHAYFIKRYNKEGFITPTYTVMGTGWHLWCISEYYQLTQDKEWLKSNADEIARVCRWLMAACEKTKKIDAFGNKVPEWGLLPPGTMADWEVFNFYFCMNGYYYAGLNAAGQALAEIDYPGANEMIAAAADLRANILRAFHWTQSQAPVYPLKDGTWVPAYPTHVYCPGPIDNFYKGEDGGRSWCYDVEIGSHHLIAQGVMDPASQDARWMMNHMEDVQFMHNGWGYDGYTAEKNLADWFNLGGFAKVQPYYARTTEVYGLQDRVKPFLRSYFNSIVSLLNRENLSLWEHFHNGAYNKTHETGYYLYQTRMMLLAEKGEQLWLAPFVTGNWLKDGMQVAVRQAPTQWGSMSYQIISHTNHGYIEAKILMPARQVPSEIVLRLRHPEGKPIRSAQVDGKACTNVDAAKDIIRFSPADAKEVYIRAYF